MLNRNILLTNLGKNWAPYTHIVTVASWKYGGSTYYGVITKPSGLQFPDPMGEITPNYFTVFGDNWPIERFYFYPYKSAYNNIGFEINGFLADYTNIYLGRSDTRENFGTPNGGGNEELGNAFWTKDVTVFTQKDIGKEVPIWLSYTPPPY